ncbi:MAG: hypothetical protein AAF170_04275 [Bacteroidota bacterium]
MSGLPSLLAPGACSDTPFGASPLLDYADVVRVVRVPTEAASHRDAALETLYGGDSGAAADVYPNPKTLTESPAGDEGRSANALVYLPTPLVVDATGAILNWISRPGPDASPIAMSWSGTVIGVRPDGVLLVHFEDS